MADPSNAKSATERAVAMAFPELVNVASDDAPMDQWYLDDCSLLTSDFVSRDENASKHTAKNQDEEVPSTPATVNTTMLYIPPQFQLNGLVANDASDSEYFEKHQDDNNDQDEEVHLKAAKPRKINWLVVVITVACLVVVAGCGSLMAIAVIHAKQASAPELYVGDETLNNPNEEVNRDEESMNRTNLIRNWLGIGEPPHGSPQQKAVDWLSNKDFPLILRNDLPSQEVHDVYKEGTLPVELSVELNDFVARLVQRYAVLVLYYSTGASYPTAGYATFTGSRLHECAWPGITCNYDETAIKSFTLDKRVTGTIPTEIGLLTNLDNLILSAQGLTGTLPSEVYTISNLYELRVSGSSLNTKLSTEIGKLTRLAILDLGGARFLGALPTQLGQLTNLRVLELYANDFVGVIPRQLGSLTDLTRASLHDTWLFGQMPNSVCKLTKFGGKLEQLTADCKNETVVDEDTTSHTTQQISCTCCTLCF